MNNVKSNSADGEKKIVKEISIFGMLSTTYQHQTLKEKNVQTNISTTIHYLVS